MTCEQCKADTMRLIIYETKLVCQACRDKGRGDTNTSTSVIGDEIPGGFTQEHFGHTPEVFYSKREMARRAKELGLMPMVRHIGENGTDKSSKTTRWI